MTGCACDSTALLEWIYSVMWFLTIRKQILQVASSLKDWKLARHQTGTRKLFNFPVSALRQWTEFVILGAPRCES
jgi:hypothetical protein